MTNFDKYIEAFMEAFDVSADECKMLSYGSIDEWDSVGHMNLIAILEGKFGIQIEPGDMVMIKSFDKGVEMLNNRYGVRFEKLS